jgi:transcriptional regulator with XRE-family HTH domain
MGLWPFVTADRVEWTDATGDVGTFLEQITIADLQDPATWRQLTTLVQVTPDADLFPVRSKYDDDAYTIGLNNLTSDEPLWFTLADCVASKLLTGRVPTIVRALRFAPVGQQADLRSLAVVGNPTYRVDPVTDDLYRRVIDLRSEVKGDLKVARDAGEQDPAARLDSEQLALKIMANATSYGIFVELNVTEYAKPQSVTCYGGTCDPFDARTPNVEEPGRYFHPMLGTLITGAARLMLALAERLATDAGLDWVFCDTDSMALAKPEGMTEDEFLVRADQVRAWFTPLNPYATKGPLFKIEDANYGLVGERTRDDIEPLFCFAVSAKRYVLFNLDKRSRPVLRKASGHGLGHLRPPYDEDAAPASIPPPSVPLRELGVERWQYDLWYRIAEAALAGHSARTRLDDLSGFDTPAVSRYAATTPTLLRWFDSYNAAKPYREQVRPFGFLLNFQRDPLAPLPSPTKSCTDEHNGSRTDAPRPVAAFDRDPAIAAARCFDRMTGAPVPPEHLKTYRQALAQYHLHPETKFANGDYLDVGSTARRHIQVVSIERIGKEANRWEEQLHLGSDPEAQIVYGSDEEGRERTIAFVRMVADRVGRRALAEAAGVSVREVGAILRGERRVTPATLGKLTKAVSHLEAVEREQIAHERAVVAAVRDRCRAESMRAFAARADAHYPHLTEVLAGRRRPSQVMLAKLEATLTRAADWAMACSLQPYYEDGSCA